MNTGRGSKGTTWANIQLGQYLHLKILEEGKNGRDYIPKPVDHNLIRKKEKIRNSFKQREESSF